MSTFESVPEADSRQDAEPVQALPTVKPSSPPHATSVFESPKRVVSPVNSSSTALLLTEDYKRKSNAYKQPSRPESPLIRLFSCFGAPSIEPVFEEEEEEEPQVLKSWKEAQKASKQAAPALKKGSSLKKVDSAVFSEGSNHSVLGAARQGAVQPFTADSPSFSREQGTAGPHQANVSPFVHPLSPTATVGASVLPYGQGNRVFPYGTKAGPRPSPYQVPGTSFNRMYQPGQAWRQNPYSTPSPSLAGGGGLASTASLPLVSSSSSLNSMPLLRNVASVGGSRKLVSQRSVRFQEAIQEGSPITDEEDKAISASWAGNGTGAASPEPNPDRTEGLEPTPMAAVLPYGSPRGTVAEDSSISLRTVFALSAESATEFSSP